MNRKMVLAIGGLIVLAGLARALGQNIYTSDINGNGTAAAIATLQSQMAGKADTSAVPVPASTPPPAVADTSATGSGTAYSLSNHTHQSVVRKAELTIAGGAGKATWTFSPAFAAGVVPKCVATPIVATNATQAAIPAISGDPTNTSVTVVVFGTQTQLVSILGVTVNVVSPVANGVKVIVICTPP